MKKILQDSGADALMEELKTARDDVNPPEGRSAAWIEGYRGGISSIRERIRRAYEDGGLPEVEAVLQRPFDASDSQ
jgi:hypothetical protein